MALDYGEKFIGIAVNEPVFMTVHGRETLHRIKTSNDVEHILTLIQNEDVDLLIVGLPLNEKGEETATSEKVRVFVRNLEKKMKYSTKNYKLVRIELWNERYTTQDATLILEERGIPKSERKKYLDQLSAILLLENYISENQLDKVEDTSLILEE